MEELAQLTGLDPEGLVVLAVVIDVLFFSWIFGKKKEEKTLQVIPSPSRSTARGRR